MTRALLAGGAGFLGSHLAELLISEGFQVTVVDDFSSGREVNLSRVKDKVEIIRSDIAELSYRSPLDMVVNLASRASRREWETEPVTVASSNSVGTHNLIEIARRNKAKFVFASSSEIYGDPEVVPTPETYVGRVNSMGPRSPYVESKRFGETLVNSYVRQYGLDGIVLRLFNSFGPRMRAGDLYGRVADRFVHQALRGAPLTVYGDGKQTRAFTYVSDTVDGILGVIKRGASGEAYNIGSDIETPIIELANLVIEISGSKSTLEFRPLPQDDSRRRAADISKIKEIGWSPKVGVKEGLRRMIEQSSWKIQLLREDAPGTDKTRQAV